jgi:diguanylate cyclase (GGDEF)-like protein
MDKLTNELTQMQGSSTVDPLTGVYSRSHLGLSLRASVEQTLLDGQPFSVLMLDLDHFKSVNEAFGYTRGDQVLVEFAHRLSQILRKDDLVFRYGGDEFVILLPNTTKSRAAQLAERLVEHIETATFSGEPAVTVSLSIGVSACPEDGVSAESVFEIADRHHYEAKRQGRNKVVQELPSGFSPALILELPELIERAPAQEALANFMHDLQTMRLAACLVCGPEGSGKTRLLTEAARLARLQGYQVLTIVGSPARQARLYGALQDAALAHLPDPIHGEKRFLEYLELLLIERGSAGILVLVDNLSDIDPGTLEFLQTWGRHLRYIPLGFVIAVPAGYQVDLAVGADTPPTLIDLLPLSMDGLGQWLQTSFSSEPPRDVLAWLYEQTGGWPGKIQAGLAFLVLQELIVQEGQNWLYRPELNSVNLVEWFRTRRKFPRSRLPAGLTELVGRSKEIEELSQLLQLHNLVFLNGPGGIGKTRLAVQIGLEFLEFFQHGIYFVPLDRIVEQDALAVAIADALELRFHGTAAVDNQLLHYLQHKNLLLILDNPEPAGELPGLLMKIINGAPSVKMLVTGRERFAVAGGVLYDLAGFECLDLVDDDDTYTPSARLFEHTARRVLPGFKINKTDRPVLGRICQLVDGMPLAIELAATWVASYTLDEIEAEVKNSLNFLSTVRSDVPVRHQSLTAVFDSFWNMLSGAEQQILSRLAVFRDGFTSQAAGLVAGASPFFLDALVSRAFLRKLGADNFAMHELLRRYSLEKLQADPEAYAEAHLKHCQNYVRELNERRVSFAKGVLPRKLVSITHENYRLAWNWALDHLLVEEMNLGVDGLYAFLHLIGSFKEGEKIFRETISRFQALPAEKLAEVKYKQLYGRFSLRLAGFLNKLGLFEEAVTYATTGAEIAEELQDQLDMASAYLEWGESLRHLGDYPQSRQLLERALQISKEKEIPFLQIDVLYAFGAVAHLQANLEEQYYYAEQVLQASLLHEDLRGQSRAYNLLAIATEMDGKYSQAKAYYERAIRLSQQVGDRRSESIPLINLAALLQLLGNYAAARSVYEHFLEIKQELSDRPGEVWGLVYLSLLFHQLDNHAVAQNYARQALASAVELGDRHNQAAALTILGHTLVGLGDFSAAEDVYQQALWIRRSLGQDHVAVEALAGLARTKLARGFPTEALPYVEDIFLYLNNNNNDSSDEPFRAWLTCWEVLQANQDPRASHILASGYELLQERARQIQDETLRLSFLENVKVHRQLCEAWQTYQAGR